MRMGNAVGCARGFHDVFHVQLTAVLAGQLPGDVRYRQRLVGRKSILPPAARQQCHFHGFDDGRQSKRLLSTQLLLRPYASSRRDWAQIG